MSTPDPRSSIVASVLPAGALACAAAAAWVSFGALAFVGTAPDSRHVGVLPSPVWLAVAVGAALLVAFIWRPRHAAVAPLWLSLVLVVPWLPMPVPLAAFVWTGHVTIWVWAAVAAATIAPWLRSSRLASAVSRLAPPRAAAVAGLLALAVYAGVAVWTAPRHPSGDEPHYLVIAQSLLRDGDLQIENNHHDRDFAAYYAGDLPPDYVRRGVNGAIYSSHAPGVAMLVLPAFALFGYPGTVALLLVLGACTSALTWWVAWRTTGSVPASWFAWAALFSAPALLTANAVFPDSVAPLLVVAGLLPQVEPRAQRPRALLAVGAGITMLPWLHTRLAILAGSLGLVVLVRLLGGTDRAKRTAAFLVVPVLGAVAWFGFFWTIYGTLDPTAPIGKRLLAPLLAEGFAGLLLDQKFGLLVAAPVTLCAAGGLAVLLTAGPRRLALEWIVIVLPYATAIAAWDMWWGGTSPPARFLVPVMPLCAVAAAVFVARARSRVALVSAAALLGLSLLIAVSMAWAGRGALIFADRPDASPLHAWLSSVVDLTKALPDGFADSPALVAMKGACWLGVLLIAGAAAARARRVPASVAFGIAGQLAATLVVGLLWTQHGGTVRKPFDAAADVARALAADDARLGVAYSPFAVMAAREVAAMAPLATLEAAAREMALGTPPLPPGTYELAASMTGGSNRGSIGVRTDRRSPPIARVDAAARPASWTERIVVPVAVPGLRVELDEAATACVRDLTLRFVSPLPPAAQAFPGVEAGHGARYGSSVFYYMSGRSWLEGPGIWVGGREGAEFAVATDEGPVQLMVRNGGTDNHVVVASGAWRTELDLTAGETRTVEVPPSRTLAATPVRVVPSNGFRPSEVDRSSTDDRFLGVWIEPSQNW